MNDFASMTDGELNLAAAKASGLSRCFASQSLDDVKRLAEALGIGVRVELYAHKRNDGTRYRCGAYAWVRECNHWVAAHNPARAATIAILTVWEEKKK